jgi:hypothetical protein
VWGSISWNKTLLVIVFTIRYLFGGYNFKPNPHPHAPQFGKAILMITIAKGRDTSRRPAFG